MYFFAKDANISISGNQLFDFKWASVNNCKKSSRNKPLAITYEQQMK